MTTPVALVTVAFHSEELLPPFLDSVGPGIPVVVVNNVPGDPSIVAAVGDRANVRLLEAGSNLGYGKGMNLGAANADDSEWLLLSNPDLSFSEGAVDELLRVANESPNVGVVGPLILTPSGEIYPSARRLPSLRNGVGHAVFSPFWRGNPWTAAYLADRENPPRQREAGWLSGACLLVRRDAFDEIGGFDDKFFMYFEDVDLCARIARTGRRIIYAPSAAVTHIGGQSTKTASRAMIRVHHQSAYKYLAARYTGWHLAPLRLALRVGLWLRAFIAKS